jgi:AcrR family transcriptional regulator
MARERRVGRQKAVSDLKRGLILDAARKVFEAEGLEGASLRAIAAAAGYTPAALYFYFESKEAIYAEVLRGSLVNLGQVVTRAIGRAKTPADRLRAAATAFFRYYADNPRDLDLGFYLFRGGMKPHGLGRERDEMLNAALESALRPIADAARSLGARREDAKWHFRACGGALAAGPHGSHAHVWCLGTESHGALYRDRARGAERKTADMKVRLRGPVTATRQ